MERHETECLLKWQRAGAPLQDQLGLPLHCIEGVPEAGTGKTLVQGQMSHSYQSQEFLRPRHLYVCMYICLYFQQYLLNSYPGPGPHGPDFMKLTA